MKLLPAGRTLPWLALLAGCLLASGCNVRSKGPPRASAAGQVTLDGSPIENGSIAFEPMGETRGMVAGGAIRNGAYQLDAAHGPVVGTNRIRILAPRKTGRREQAALRDAGQTIDAITEAVPARFNSQSELERQVAPGQNRFDFELTSD